MSGRIFQYERFNPKIFGSPIRFIEDTNMLEDGKPVTTKRSILERLFTRPWRPLVKTTTVVPRVPLKAVYKMEGGVIVGHPATIQELKRELKKGGDE